MLRKIVLTVADRLRNENAPELHVAVFCACGVERIEMEVRISFPQCLSVAIEIEFRLNSQRLARVFSSFDGGLRLQNGLQIVVSFTQRSQLASKCFGDKIPIEIGRQRRWFGKLPPPLFQ